MKKNIQDDHVCETFITVAMLIVSIFALAIGMYGLITGESGIAGGSYKIPRHSDEVTLYHGLAGRLFSTFYLSMGVLMFPTDYMGKDRYYVIGARYEKIKYIIGGVLFLISFISFPFVLVTSNG